MENQKIIDSIEQIQKVIEAQQMLLQEMKNVMIEPEIPKSDTEVSTTEEKKSDIIITSKKPTPKSYSPEYLQKYHQDYYNNKYKVIAKEKYTQNKEEIKKKISDRYRKKKEEQYKAAHNGSLEGFSIRPKIEKNKNK